MLRDYLNSYMSKNNLSVQDVADLTGVSANTLQNIRSGKTESPNMITAAQIVKSLGGSLDAIAGIDMPQPAPSSVPFVCPQRDALINLYERMLASKNRWIRCLFTALIVLVIFIVTFLIFDLMHGNWGYFRY